MTKTHPLVTVIIVNWNGIRYLSDCLQSLAKIKYPNLEILFVDNASSDDSVEYVEKNYPNIIMLHNATNMGFAQGHEVALKKAKGDAILLLSTDTIISPNVIDEMMETLYSADDVGAVQPKLLLYGEDNKIDSIGSFFMMSGMLYHFGRAKNASLPQYNQPMEIYSAKGACMLFRREVLKRSGLFDNDYFAYFEETDLCHRIWLSGYRIVYTPKAEVIHKGGGSSKQMMPSYIYFHSYKNRITTYLKCLSLSYLLRVLPSTFVLYEVVTIMYLLTRKPASAWAVQRAMWWNVTNLSKTLKKRKYIQEKMRRVKDKDFLPRITRTVRLSYYYHLFFNLAKFLD